MSLRLYGLAIPPIAGSGHIHYRKVASPRFKNRISACLSCLSYSSGECHREDNAFRLSSRETNLVEPEKQLTCTRKNPQVSPYSFTRVDTENKSTYHPLHHFKRTLQFKRHQNGLKCYV